MNKQETTKKHKYLQKKHKKIKEQNKKKYAF